MMSLINDFLMWAGRPGRLLLVVVLLASLPKLATLPAGLFELAGAAALAAGVFGLVAALVGLGGEPKPLEAILDDLLDDIVCRSATCYYGINCSHSVNICSGMKPTHKVVYRTATNLREFCQRATSTVIMTERGYYPLCVWC